MTFHQGIATFIVALVLFLVLLLSTDRAADEPSPFVVIIAVALVHAVVALFAARIGMVWP